LLKPLRKLRDKVNFVLIVNDRPQKGIKPIAPFACLVELHLDAKPLEQGSDLGGCLAALLQMAFSSMQRSANMESVALKAPDIVARTLAPRDEAPAPIRSPPTATAMQGPMPSVRHTTLVCDVPVEAGELFSRAL
jgi:hypothetical protein